MPPFLTSIIGPFHAGIVFEQLRVPPDKEEHIKLTNRPRLAIPQRASQLIFIIYLENNINKKWYYERSIQAAKSSGAKTAWYSPRIRHSSRYRVRPKLPAIGAFPENLVLPSRSIELALRMSRTNDGAKENKLERTLPALKFHNHNDGSNCRNHNHERP